jgi:outer membrane protein, heavy metal efflux system
MRITTKLCSVFALLLWAETTLCEASSSSGNVDTVFITLEKAEDRFVQNNLQLLAARFGIGAAKAAAYQAGLWSNPNIAVEQNAYNKYTNKYFDVSRTGNTEVQLQQLKRFNSN